MDKLTKMIVYRIFVQNWCKITGVYLLMLLDTLAIAIMPKVLGRVVDDLLQSSYTHFWIYTIGGTLVFGFRIVHGMIDTRVFAGAWSKLTTDIVKTLIRNEMPVHKIMTRAELSVRFIDFYEFTVPAAINCGVTFMTAFVILIGLVPSCMITIVTTSILLFIWMWFTSAHWKRADSNQQAYTDDWNNAITAKLQSQISKVHRPLTRCFVCKSDWHAVFTGSTNICAVLISALVILTLVSTNQSVGSIMATTSYVVMLFAQFKVMFRQVNAWHGITVAQDKLDE